MALVVLKTISPGLILLIQQQQASEKAIPLAIFQPFPLIFFAMKRDRKEDKSHTFWKPDLQFVLFLLVK